MHRCNGCGDSRGVLYIFGEKFDEVISLKNGEAIDFDTMSEELFAWAKKWIAEDN